MNANQTPTTDKPLRASALSGAVIALAAVVGIDCAISASAIQDANGTSGALVRTIVPSKPSLLSASTGLSWTVAAFVLLLLSRRVPTLAGEVTVAQVSPDRTRLPEALSLLRRRLTVSYHLGGLYGP